MLSNINRGVPSNYNDIENSKGCKDKIVNIIGKYKDYVLYSFIGALLVIFLNHIILIYLCCKSKRNPQHLNSYLELAGERNNLN